MSSGASEEQAQGHAEALEESRDPDHVLTDHPYALATHRPEFFETADTTTVEVANRPAHQSIEPNRLIHRLPGSFISQLRKRCSIASTEVSRIDSRSMTFP